MGGSALIGGRWDFNLTVSISTVGREGNVDERLRWEFAILALLLTIAGVLAVIWLGLGFEKINGELSAIHLKGLVGVAVLVAAGRCAWRSKPNPMGRVVFGIVVVLAAIGVMSAITFVAGFFFV